MEIIYGNYIWKLYMEIIYGNYIWKLDMEIIYGNYIWKLYMEIIYENYIWKLYMEIHCESRKNARCNDHAPPSLPTQPVSSPAHGTSPARSPPGTSPA
jgi:hypothetical protein